MSRLPPEMSESFVRHRIWYILITDSTPPFTQQVKQIMEEAVTRKFVHEDSSHIISFCGMCLLSGLVDLNLYEL